MTKKVLGKGLGALIGNKSSAPKPTESAPSAASSHHGEMVRQIPLNLLYPSPLQPRKFFSEDQLDDLTNSIKEQGIIHPLIVRETQGKYELIAGERRWRAAQRAGLKLVPVIVRQASDREILELALVENLQRSDLNPIEEAEGYELLLQKYKLTQEEIARKVGKNRATVANAVRLTALPPAVKSMVQKNLISAGHAKAILGLNRPEDQIALAEEIVKKSLSVRIAESMVQTLSSVSGTKKKTTKSKSSNQADWRDLELRIQRTVGTKARIVGTSQKGRIEIDYYNDSDLERIISLLGVKFE
jgi:ParB family transcriptional regulator, chromosome partitioning protein